MKNLYLILLITNFAFCQTNFQFDYMLHYSHYNYTDSTKCEKVYYLTNSKDNSYLAKITIKDSLNLRLVFLKQDQLYSDVLLSKNNYLNGKTINIDCKNIRPLSNPFKYKERDYDYLKVKNSDSLESYEIISLKSEKYKKKKKIGKYLLKFNPALPYHLPNLFYSTLYEEWNKEKDLPNNFLSEYSFYNFENKLIFTEELLEYIKIDKEINIITTECGDFYLEKILKLKQ